MSTLVIRPRKGLENVVAAMEQDAEFWSIYEVQPDGCETWLADCVSKEVAKRFATPAYALVEVMDGVAELTMSTGNVEVAVVDWDNIRAGDKLDPGFLNHPVFGTWIEHNH